eukprot:4154912-Pleurochrysis_carterae.AAC.1
MSWDRCFYLATTPASLSESLAEKAAHASPIGAAHSLFRFSQSIQCVAVNIASKYRQSCSYVSSKLPHHLVSVEYTSRRHSMPCARLRVLSEARFSCLLLQARSMARS